MNCLPTDVRPPLEECLLSVVLPVYNESRVLRRLVTCVRDSLVQLGMKYEIVFVDDGSTDGSGEVLDQLSDYYSEIRVIHFSRNFGHQAAVQAGLAHARGDAVVIMDSDMQDSPDAIARFLERWREGYDVVYAVRVDRKEGAWKRCLFAGFHRFLSHFSTVRIPIDAGNFSLIDARAAQLIVSLGERDRYLPGLRAWVGFKQIGVEVERGARYDDHPRVSLRGLWRLAKTAIFSFSGFPLLAFYAIGYAAIGLFAAVGGYALFCKLFTASAIPGWTSSMLIGSFFGALNAMGISMLGEYVTRIYDQVRGRPLYLIDRTVNCQVQPVLGPTCELPEFDGYDDAEQQYQSLLAQAEELLGTGYHIAPNLVDDDSCDMPSIIPMSPLPTV